jgi:GT2 family glycosyltransferase
MMKLSIVIINWNVQDLLAKCLVSIDANLRSSAMTNVETLVVDNASTDGSVKMLRERFPWVKVIANPDNCGFARANNQAIALAGGELILLLNPDTEMLDDSLRILIDYLDQNPTVAAVGPMLKNPDGTLQFSCSPTPSLLREAFRLIRPNRMVGSGAYAMETWSPTEARQVDVIQGACLMVRRQVLDQVGWLDEDYFIYTEEVDLCTRIGEAGWQIVWIPTAKVIHYGGQSTRQVALEMFLQLYASKVIFFRKRRGDAAAQLYKLILIVASLLRITLAAPAWLLGRGRREQYARVANNYRHLLAALPAI